MTQTGHLNMKISEQISFSSVACFKYSLFCNTTESTSKKCTLNLSIRLSRATSISFHDVNFELCIDPLASSSFHAFSVCQDRPIIHQHLMPSLWSWGKPIRWNENYCVMALLTDIRMQIQTLMWGSPNSVIKLHPPILSELEVCGGICNGVKKQISPSMNFMGFSQVENSTCSLVNDVLAPFFPQDETFVIHWPIMKLSHI